MNMWARHTQITDAPEDFRFSAAHVGALMQTSDYLGANVGQEFDDSGVGMGVDRYRILSADPNKRQGIARRRGRGIMSYGLSPDAMSEEEWRASEYYRAGLPFDRTLSPLQHKERARQYDERQINKAQLSAYEPSPLEAIAGFGARMLGASASPETFLPVGGLALRGVLAARAAKAGWGVRSGAVAADMGGGAIEGAIGSALILPFVKAQRDYMGDPMSVAEMSMDIALSAFGGAVLSGVSGAVARNLNPDLWTSVYQKQRVVRGVAQAQQALREGELKYQNPVLDAMMQEGQELGQAWDEVYNNPIGEPDNPIVHITPENIEATIVERGQFKNLGHAEVKGSGYGLVKFIWKHGKKSNKPKHKQIRKEDVTNFPHIIREYEAQEVYITGKGGTQIKTQGRRWVFEREDGELLVYADNRFKEDGKRRVVTIHVLNDEERLKYQTSKKKDFPAASLRRDFSVSSQDTNQEPFSRPNGGRQDNRQDGASDDNLAQEEAFVEMELEDIRNNGGFTPEEAADLEAADADVARAEAVARGLEAGALCVARRG